MNIVKSYTINIKTFDTFTITVNKFYNKDMSRDNKLRIYNSRTAISNRWHIKKL